MLIIAWVSCLRSATLLLAIRQPELWTKWHPSGGARHLIRRSGGIEVTPIHISAASNREL